MKLHGGDEYPEVVEVLIGGIWLDVNDMRVSDDGNKLVANTRRLQQKLIIDAEQVQAFKFKVQR